MCALGCLEKQEKEQDQLKVSTKKVLLSKVNGIGKKKKMAVFSSFILNLNIHEAIVEDNTKEITQATALKIMNAGLNYILRQMDEIKKKKEKKKLFYILGRSIFHLGYI